MSCRKLIASAVLCAAVAGCQTPSLTPAGQSSTSARPLSSLPVEHKEKGPDAVPRSQMPDADPPQPILPATLLDLTPSASAGRLVATIRATVNGVPILDQDIRAVASGGTAEDMKKALDMLIERELVLQDCNEKFSKGPAAKFLDKLKESAAKEFDRQVVSRTKNKMKFKSDDEFKRWLKEQGVTLDTLRKQWEKQFIFQQYLQFRVSPVVDRQGHIDIRDYFDSHPEEFENSDSVQWHDIFIAASAHPNRAAALAVARQVEARMKQGEEIAKLLPLDNGDSTYRGGEGLGQKRGEVKPREAESILFQLQEKETSIVETGGGYHVVRVVKRETAGRMPFDEKAQTLIRDKLKNDAYSREAKRFLADLKRKATIEIAKD